MEIYTRTIGTLQIVHATGAATVESHEKLKHAVKTALDCGRNSFVVNLSQLTSIDSMTIGELVACLKRVREAEGDLALIVVPGGSVHDVLQRTGLERIFRIFGSEAEATAVATAAPN